MGELVGPKFPPVIRPWIPFY